MGSVHRQMQFSFLVIPVGLGLQLLTMLLIAAHLGPSLFGVYSVIFGMMNVASFVTEMGLGTIITKRVAEARQPPSHYISVALPVVCAVGAVSGLVLLAIVCTAYSASQARLAGVVACVNIVFFGGSMVLTCALRGLGEIGKCLIGFVSHKVIALAIVIGVLRPFGGGLATAMSVWLAGNLVLVFYYAIMLWPGAWRGQVQWNLAEVRSLIGESIPVGLIAAINRLAMELDTFILAILMPDRVVGLYATGQRLINPVRNILYGAVSIPTFPRLCRLAGGERDPFSRYATRLSLIQWTSGLVIALVAWSLAPLVIPLLLRAEFNDSIDVIQITAWALAPACLTLQLRYVYIALTRQSRFLALNAVFLAIKVILLVLLTWRYGIWGACYGTVLAECLLVLIMRVGVINLGVRLRLGWRVAAPTVATAAWVVAVWALGDWPKLSLALAAVYVLMAVYVVNRLLRSVRAPKPDPSARSGRLGDETFISP